jgi:hypothetical protein
LPLVLAKAQKVSFPIHLKIHPTPHINVILSGVAIGEADGNAVEGSYRSPKGWREGRAASTPRMIRFANHPLRSGRQTDKQLSQPINSDTIRKQRSRSANSGASNPARATRSS